MSEPVKPSDKPFIFTMGAVVGFLLAAFIATYSTHRSSSMSRYCVETDANGSQRCVTPEELDAIVLRALAVPPQEPK